MNNWKTAMYQSEIEAQVDFSKADHRHTMETLESLICNAYRSGNEDMEKFYRDTLNTYERTAYDV